MRPGALASADALPPIHRKPSFASSTSSSTRNSAPTSFFLARESDIDSRTESSTTELPTPPTVCSLEEAISGIETSDNDPFVQRRRSTIKPGTSNVRSQSSQSHKSEPLTPILLPTSGDASLPSSPKSISSRSLHNPDDGSISDEVTSQAIASSGEEEEAGPGPGQDSLPQLIMPSIKMPSRRPFTGRGRELGRLKIMVAGGRGSGKTSLIKSIVQTCEDIVHVDPLESTPAASTTLNRSNQGKTTEIYASTKPYPTWWSELDESKILRRRKSLGDTVLERNLCFVDTAPSGSGEHLIQYLEQQLQLAINSVSRAGGDFLNLLNGSGGPQVDIILYLVLKDTLSRDLDTIRLLSEISNVVPLIAKSDTLTEEEILHLKSEIKDSLTTRTNRPFEFPCEDTEDQPPYAVSAAISSDSENMDASLLMSSEYIQPLITSQLSNLVKKVFEKDTLAYLRHSSAKKLVSYRTQHPQPIAHSQTPGTSSPLPASSISSPVLSSVSASGVLIPYHASDSISLTTSNSYTLARLADHTQREDRLAQIRLAKWATDLQQSLNRERERYERLAQGDRAMWLLERMGQEVRDGRLQPLHNIDGSERMEKASVDLRKSSTMTSAFATNDPLGVLKWNDDIRTRGWVALQVVGSFGVIGGLAVWLARTWGWTWAFGGWGIFGDGTNSSSDSSSLSSIGSGMLQWRW